MASPLVTSTAAKVRVRVRARARIRVRASRRPPRSADSLIPTLTRRNLCRPPPAPRPHRSEIRNRASRCRQVRLGPGLGLDFELGIG